MIHLAIIRTKNISEQKKKKKESKTVTAGTEQLTEAEQSTV